MVFKALVKEEVDGKVNITARIKSGCNTTYQHFTYNISSTIQSLSLKVLEIIVGTPWADFSLCLGRRNGVAQCTNRLTQERATGCSTGESSPPMPPVSSSPCCLTGWRQRRLNKKSGQILILLDMKSLTLCWNLPHKWRGYHRIM